MEGNDGAIDRTRIIRSIKIDIPQDVINRGGNKMECERADGGLYIAAQSLAVYTLAAISPKAMTNPVLGLSDDRNRWSVVSSRHCLPLRAAKPVGSGTSCRALGRLGSRMIDVHLGSKECFTCVFLTRDW